MAYLPFVPLDYFKYKIYRWVKGVSREAMRSTLDATINFVYAPCGGTTV